MRTRVLIATGFTCWALLVACAPPADAQMTDEWKFNAVIYGYFPDIRGQSTFGAETGRDGITVDAHAIIDNLKFAFMGTFEAQKGRWGFLTDLLYMDVGSSKSQTRNLSIGNVQLPAGVTANLNLDIKSAVWELAGTYQVSSDPTAPFGVLAGARMLELKQTLGWEFSADLGPTQPSRSGSKEIKATNWEGSSASKGGSPSVLIESGSCPIISTWAPATRISHGRRLPDWATRFIGAT